MKADHGFRAVQGSACLARLYAYAGFLAGQFGGAVRNAGCGRFEGSQVGVTQVSEGGSYAA